MKKPGNILKGQSTHPSFLPDTNHLVWDAYVQRLAYKNEIYLNNANKILDY